MGLDLYRCKSRKFFLAAGLVIFLGLRITAQTNSELKWSSPAFEAKVFVENAGQFDGRKLIPGSAVQYGVDNEGYKIYFTSTGLTFWHERVDLAFYASASNKVRTYYDVERSKLVPQVFTLNMEWVGADPVENITASEPVSEYFNYGLPDGRHISHARGFKKLTYKNLYPDIDVVYEFHPETGIKYSLILHPGCDPGRIKMKYSGFRKISSDSKGNILINLPVGDVTDHAPVSFYADSKEGISSSFRLDGDEVSFSLGDYDKSRTVIIDPWTVSPGMITSNRILDIGTDNMGNVYVFGSINSFKLKKFSPAGAALWTYNSPWGGTNWYGDMVVDSSGNAYISNGSANATLQKISTTGLMLVSTQGASGVMELFHFCFSKTQPNSIGLIGAQPPAACGAAYVNTLTGVVGSPSTLTPIPTGENRGLCASKNGNFYTLTTDGTGVNGSGTGKVIGFTYALLNVWTTNSGYGANIPYDGPVYTGMNTPGTQNSINASNCFVYTYDGRTIKKFNASTGALLGSAVVPGGSVGNNSGIFVDECDYIYVGTTSGVSKFDVDLSFISSAATTGAVYDVDHNYVTGEIIAAGNGFVASLNLMSPGCAVTFCGATVPVKLLNFDTRMSGENVILGWSTGSELNTDRFIVERSTDGISFGPVGTLKAAGSSSSLKEYEYTDKPGRPGMYYYRIGQVGAGGEVSYSGVRSISLGRISAFKIVPNPVVAGDNLSVTFNLSESDEVEIRLSNLQGQVLYHSKRQLNKGANQIRIEMPDAPKGVYFINVMSGGEVTVNKFVKE